MSPRRLLLALAALAVGVALGVGVNEARHAGDGPALAADAPDIGLPSLSPAAGEPVAIGDPDPAPPLALPELTALNGLFTGVVARVKPAVVFIRADAEADVPEDAFHEGLALPQATQAGSGVIVSPEGYVVTNAHVVAGARRIRVLLDDRREFDAELVGADRPTDLAVVRLLEVRVGADEEEDPLPVAALGDSDALEIGEWVLAVGSPFRLTNTVTTGVVSALGRQVDIIEDELRVENFIQTDAAINPGNSGGALVNLRGEVVGVATAIATESGGYEGYGFAVPVNIVRRVAADLIARGEVERGYLGVEIRPVTAADARELGMRRVEGVLIASVAEGGAAARAGLQRGDVLLRVDGEPVDQPNHFQSRILLRRPGEPVALDVFRRGQALRFRARLIGRDDPSLRRWLADLGEPREPGVAPDGAAPPPDAPSEEVADWGVRLRDLTAAERRLFGVAGGALVEVIAPGSAADVDGLLPGTVITRVEDTLVGSAAEARVLLAERARLNRPTLLRVRRRDGLTAFYDLASPYVE